MPLPSAGCIVGVFDLFHIGHLDQLRLAVAATGSLVVALPSDDLMESRTGARPFVPETERAEIVGAVRGVARVELVDDLDLTGLVHRTGAGVVLLSAGDGLDDVLVPAGVAVRELTGRDTGSVTVRAALRRKRGDLGSNVA